MTGYDYKVLSADDRSRLRLERVRSLEAEICRAELGLEDALSDAEREGIIADIEVIHRRLLPHYLSLGLATVSRSDRGGSEDENGAPASPDQLPTPQ